VSFGEINSKDNTSFSEVKTGRELWRKNKKGNTSFNERVKKVTQASKNKK